jgi:hypothetical protein
VLDQPRNYGQNDTDQNARDNREVEGGVLATIGDIAGQSADGQPRATEKKDEAAHHEQENPEYNDRAAQF